MSVLFKHKVNWKYAIGEVILIFIGITLAIAFNNWNELRKQNILGTEYVKSIYSNLQRDINVFNNHIVKLVDQKQDSRKVLEIIDDAEHMIDDTISFMNNLVVSSEGLRIERPPSTWDELLLKGMINILKDDSLIDLLQTYFLQYDFVITNFSELPKAKRMEIRVLSGEGVDLQSLDSYWINDTKSSPSKGHVDALIQSKALRAALFNVNISSEFNIRRVKDLIGKAESIMDYMEENHPDIIAEENE